MKDSNLFESNITPTVYYEQQDLGFNYIEYTDIQAALSRTQLRSLKKYISKRWEIANRYDAEISNTNVIKPKLNDIETPQIIYLSYKS